MRISTSAMVQQSVASMTDKQSSLAKLQTQMSSGQRLQTAADDPAGWARGMAMDGTLANIETWNSNISMAQQRLGMEDSALSDASNVLQSVQTLAIQATNGTQTPQSLQTIAGQLQQYYDQLVSTANAQDGQGHYLFAGSKSATAPFAQSGGSVQYNGDSAGRLLSIGESRTIADGDDGASVFMNNLSGNGRFVTAAASGNTGTAQVGNTQVLNASQWDGGSYSIGFSGGNYQVKDSGGNVVASGAYSSGGSISFRGVQITMSGTPADGDSFSVTPSTSKDVFASLRDLINLVKSPATDAAGRARQQTAMQSLQSELSSAFNTVTDKRSSVGTRLSALDDASNRLADQSVSVKTALSGVRDLDMVQATTQLNLTSTSLQALQLAYTKVQSLSLFQYLR